jgi:hypothetical protein
MLLTWHNHNLSVEFRQIAYDLAALRKTTLASAMPYANWWLNNWIPRPAD